MNHEEQEIADQIKESLEKAAQTTQSATSTMDDLEKEFDEFRNSKSAHDVETQTGPEEKTQKKNIDPFTDPSNDISVVEDFKLQMFLGLFFSLLDGVHLFLYRFISKTEIDKDKFCLDDEDKEGLAVYFKTKRILEIINKLPSELIGLVHMEYLYFQRFQEIKNSQIKPERKLLHTPPGKKKQAPKKKAAKKKAKKKSPVKKIKEPEKT